MSLLGRSSRAAILFGLSLLLAQVAAMFIPLYYTYYPVWPIVRGPDLLALGLLVVILFFASVFCVFAFPLAKKYGDVWLALAGASFVAQFTMAIASVVFAWFSPAAYFSLTASLLPPGLAVPAILAQLVYGHSPDVSYLLPTLPPVVSSIFLAAAAYFLKKRMGISDFDGTIIFLIAGLFISPLLISLGILVFGLALRRGVAMGIS